MKTLFLCLVSLLSFTAVAEEPMTMLKTICELPQQGSYDQRNTNICKSGLLVRAWVTKHQGGPDINTYGLSNQDQAYFILHSISSQTHETCESLRGNCSMSFQVHDEQNLNLSFFTLEQMDRFISDRFCNRALTTGLSNFESNN